MGIYKASYNRISKSSFTSPRENIKRLSEKIFSPLLIQRKNWTPLCAGKTKKTYTSTHNKTRGAVCIPASSYCTCMYRSSLFVYVCFYPTASWVLYLNTAFFICPVRIKKHFSLSTVEQILIRSFYSTCKRLIRSFLRGMHMPQAIRHYRRHCRYRTAERCRQASASTRP